MKTLGTKIVRTVIHRAVLLLATAGVVPLALGQTTANISGTVEDATGAIISGAHVTLINTATLETREVDSNSSGYFSFAGIVPGSYKVDIAAKGFRGFEQPGITVNPGDTRALT